MTNPDFYYESIWWDKNLIVAGADEVGRGCLAGPVVTAVCVFHPSIRAKIKKIGEKIIIKDSKKMTASQRKLSADWIKKNALSWGIGFGSVYEINKFGIKEATNKSFRRAIKLANLNLNKLGVGLIERLLVDAFYISYAKGVSKKKQVPIVKGDMKSISIASASIIAKVYRDEYMQNLGRRSLYMKYFWQENKGYGTRKHREAILNHGPTKFHRRLFISKTLTNSGQFSLFEV
ncbi:MAG: ribonuclease HII [Patescibacteria group bacterium]|nr:ribonuclease HII [Patescibacteria group bacterium]